VEVAVTSLGVEVALPLPPLGTASRVREGVREGSGEGNGDDVKV